MQLACQILAHVPRSDYRNSMLKGIRFKLHFGPYRRRYSSTAPSSRMRYAARRRSSA